MVRFCERVTPRDCLIVGLLKITPNANGATMSNPCDDDTCRCFAEINMDDWLYDRTSYESCQFLEGTFLDTRKKVTNSFCFKSIYGPFTYYIISIFTFLPNPPLL